MTSRCALSRCIRRTAPPRARAPQRSRGRNSRTAAPPSSFPVPSLFAPLYGSMVFIVLRAVVVRFPQTPHHRLRRSCLAQVDLVLRSAILRCKYKIAKLMCAQKPHRGYLHNAHIRPEGEALRSCALCYQLCEKRLHLLCLFRRRKLCLQDFAPAQSPTTRRCGSSSQKSFLQKYFCEKYGNSYLRGSAFAEK